MKRITNRHKGLSLRFSSHNGKTYWATLLGIRHGIARIKYDLTNEHGLVVGKYDGYVKPERLQLPWHEERKEGR